MVGFQGWRSLLFVVLTATCACTDTVQHMGAQERVDDRASVVVLSGANVIEGTGLPALAGATIVVEGTRITCFGTAKVCPAPEDSKRYEQALPGFQAAVGRGRQDAAGLRVAGIRGLPEVWQA